MMVIRQTVRQTAILTANEQMATQLYAVHLTSVDMPALLCMCNMLT